MTKTDIQVDTSQYREVHGHEPKGYGYWAFDILVGEQEQGYIAACGQYSGARTVARGQMLRQYPNQRVTLRVQPSYREDAL
jgi:hypothetical protein